MDEGGQSPEGLFCHAAYPPLLREDVLNHERADVDERNLKEMEAQDRGLLVLEALRSGRHTAPDGTW